MSNLQTMSSQSVVHRRLPNFEILRVLAMFLIIVGHFFFHGLCGEGNGVMLSYDGKSVLDTVSFGIAQSLWVFSSISVNLYVLISGYFLVQSKAKWGKIPSIWMQTAFYSVCIYLVFVAIGLGVRFSIKGFISSILVVRYGAVADRTYWFVAQYVGLLALSPFLNRLVAVLTKVEYKTLIIVLLLLDFSFGYVFYGNVYSGGQTLFHFISVYFIAGYIRHYQLFGTWSKRKLLGVCAIVIVAVVALDYMYCLAHCIKHQETFQLHLSSRYLNNNGIPLVIAVLVFCMVQRASIGDSRLVRFLVAVAPFSFGVYLMHDNIYVRGWLWRLVTSYMSFSPSNVVLCSLSVALSIYAVCTGIDMLRALAFRSLRIEVLAKKIVSLAGRLVGLVVYK